MPGSIANARLIVGMEVHVELATRSKMFSRAPNPAHADSDGAEPNALLDATVAGLPGALPVPNRRGVELAMMVGLALNCQIAPRTRWDRKSYFYADLPKGYQISQYELPLCFDGGVEMPPALAGPGPPRRIGIARAHLEEDAGKLLHERPGGGAIDHTLADFNRAGAPLLEVVTQPDFRSADEAVWFARMLHGLCRFLGVTRGVLQAGHVRFEPNINMELTLADGRTVRTPIVEVKNLNSFKALRGAIEHEQREQPARFLRDGRVAGPGTKSTRGWDDAAGVTLPQRSKEDAHDYRYFPDPDLPPLDVPREWVEQVRAALPEVPEARAARYERDFELSAGEAGTLTQDRADADLFEGIVEALARLGVERPRAGRLAANILVQACAKLANERGVALHELGARPAELARVAALREARKINNRAVEPLLNAIASPSPTDRDVESLAVSMGLIVAQDASAVDAWVDQVLARHAAIADDVRAGKVQAIGRLVGEVMKLAGGGADAKSVRDSIAKRLGVG